MNKRIAYFSFVCILLSSFIACGDDPLTVTIPENSSEAESSSSVESSSDSSSSKKEEPSEKSSSSAKSSSSSKKTQSSSSSLASSSSKNEPAESSSSSVSSSSSKNVVENYPDAEVRVSGTYDCSKYSCVTTEFLNQNILEAKEYGEVLDPRDGKVYKTVQIASHVWMAQNLNYETEESYCYKGEDEYCAKYGRLYKWSDAVDSAECDYGTFCSLSTNVQGVCPNGWHLPSEDEWKKLFEFIGTYGSTTNIMWAGKKLKSRTGWQGDGNGADDYGFSAYPTGYKVSVSGKSAMEGSNMYAWTATEYSKDGAKYVKMSHNLDEVGFYQSKEALLSVRCLRNSRSASGEWAILPKFQSDYGEVITSKDDYLNPDVYYDSIVDPRDGQVYKTAKIDSMVWMAQNLNYADSAKTPSLLGQSWCYNDDDSYCKVGGRLYTWTAAVDSVKLATRENNPMTCGLGEHCKFNDEKVQGLCPDGWHLPSEREWYSIMMKLGTQTGAGAALKAQHGWRARNGSDDFGFSFLPVGGRFSSRDGSYPDNFNYAGEDAFFWASTSYDDERAYRMNVTYSGDIAHLGYYPKYFGHPIRCVKN